MPYADMPLYADLSSFVVAIQNLLPEYEVSPGYSRLAPCAESVENPKPRSAFDGYKLLIDILEDDFFHELLRGIQIDRKDYTRPLGPDEFLQPNKTGSEFLNSKFDQSLIANV